MFLKERKGLAPFLDKKKRCPKTGPETERIALHAVEHNV
jgi:hypothetical protein